MRTDELRTKIDAAIEIAQSREWRIGEGAWFRNDTCCPLGAMLVANTPPCLDAWEVLEEFGLDYSIENGDTLTIPNPCPKNILDALGMSDDQVAEFIAGVDGSTPRVNGELYQLGRQYRQAILDGRYDEN